MNVTVLVLTALLFGSPSDPVSSKTGESRSEPATERREPVTSTVLFTSREPLEPAPDGLVTPLQRTELAVVAGTGRWMPLGRPARSERLLARDAPRSVSAPLYFELSVRSEALLRWSRVGSIALRGSAALSIEAPWETGPLAVPRRWMTLHHFGTIELELRRGRLVVELPNGYLASVESAAIFARELPNGGIEVRHRGGASVTLVPLGLGDEKGHAGDDGAVRLRAGERVVLPRRAR